jgi:hypothetical protein
MKAIENALARGGKDDKGADVAIVPLPAFAASYEALKALDPVMFLTVGWSHGEDVVAGELESFDKLPKTGPISINGLPGSSSTFLAAFVLQAEGVAPERLELEPRSTEEPKALVWGLQKGDVKSAPEAVRRHQLLTTAEAVNLIPYVAVAQRTLVSKHTEALVAWARVWLSGQARVEEDPTSAARQIAKLEGGPEPLELMARLGRMTNSSITDNARATGAAGRGAVTLSSLFAQSWDAWRALKVLSTPPPERSPVSGDVVAPLVLEDTPKARGEKPTPQPADEQEKPLLVIDPGAGKLDEAELLEQAGFFAGVFSRSTVHLAVFTRSTYDEKLTTALTERVRDRFDVPEWRLAPRAIKPTSLSPYLLEVMPVH